MFIPCVAALGGPRCDPVGALPSALRGQTRSVNRDSRERHYDVEHDVERAVA
jgi:hypothetical protein